LSSSVTFVTGHEAAGKYRPEVNWAAIAQGSETIVIYMGMHNLPNIVRALGQAGLAEDTPVALVRWGTRPDQDELVATLSTVEAEMIATGFTSPAVVVIGQVVNLRQVLETCRPEIVSAHPGTAIAGRQIPPMPASTMSDSLARMD
jgi:uroporphyrin-III C-methyltransferase